MENTNKNVVLIYNTHIYIYINEGCVVLVINEIN